MKCALSLLTLALIATPIRASDPHRPSMMQQQDPIAAIRCTMSHMLPGMEPREVYRLLPSKVEKKGVYYFAGIDNTFRADFDLEGGELLQLRFTDRVGDIPPKFIGATLRRGNKLIATIGE